MPLFGVFEVKTMNAPLKLVILVLALMGSRWALGSDDEACRSVISGLKLPVISEVIRPKSNRGFRDSFLSRILNWRKPSLLLETTQAVEEIISVDLRTSLSRSEPLLGLNPKRLALSEYEDIANRIAKLQKTQPQDQSFLSDWYKNFQEVSIENRKFHFQKKPENLPEEQWNLILDSIYFSEYQFYRLARKASPYLYNEVIVSIHKERQQKRSIDRNSPENKALLMGVAIGGGALGYIIGSEIYGAGDAARGVGAAVFLATGTVKMVSDWIWIFEGIAIESEERKNFKNTQKLVLQPTEELVAYVDELKASINQQNRLLNRGLGEIHQLEEKVKRISFHESMTNQEMFAQLSSIGIVTRAISAHFMASALHRQHPFKDLNRMTLERLKYAFESGVPPKNISQKDRDALFSELNLIQQWIDHLKKLMPLLDQLKELASQARGLSASREQDLHTLARLVYLVNIQIHLTVQSHIEFLAGNNESAQMALGRADYAIQLMDLSQHLKGEVVNFEIWLNQIDKQLVEVESED